jgi:hypothetical protein
MKILKSKIFPENIIAGVTMRNLEIFKNVGFELKNREHVKELATQIGVKTDNMLLQAQCHSDIIVLAEKGIMKESDAMITKEKGLIINISIADCAAILIYDPINELIAGVHSGWRGTKEKILPKTIKKMINEFDSNPLDLLLYFSPMASKKNYEVGREFLDYFPRSIEIRNDKYYFNNTKQLQIDIEEFGIPKKNFEIADICTIENGEYHSFRRDREKSGRMSAFIGMKFT